MSMSRSRVPFEKNKKEIHGLGGGRVIQSRKERVVDRCGSKKNGGTDITPSKNRGEGARRIYNNTL